MSPAVLLLHASGARGGGATHVLRLARGLAERGIRPILAADPDGPLLEEARGFGIETAPIPFMRGRLHPGALLALRRLIQARRPSLIHAHGARAGLSAALLARMGSGRAPFVYTEHGLAADVSRSRTAARLALAAERMILGAADRVIVLSDYAAGRIASIAPGSSRRVRVIPQAVEPVNAPRSRAEIRSELGIPAEARVAGTIARFVPQKAPLDLVAMARELARLDPGVCVLAIGDGPLRARAEQEAASCGAPVVFAGERADAVKLLPGLDVFVLVSRWEGVPIAILEAMAAGVPVVATDVGGTSSLVCHDVTGILVPSGEPALCARAVHALLVDRDQALALADRAREYVREHHGEKELLDRTVAVYREVQVSAR